MGFDLAISGAVPDVEAVEFGAAVGRRDVQAGPGWPELRLQIETAEYSLGVSERPEVSLRPFEPGDAAAVHRWFNNPEATKTLMEQRESFSLEEAEGWVGRAMDDSGEDRKYAIVVEGHEEPVGFTALYGLFRQTAPELGALIGDDVRGKGVGRRAEALTIAKAFDEFGAHRVYGRIPASQRGGEEDGGRVGMEVRGDDAGPPATAPAASMTARSGAFSRTSSARGRRGRSDGE